MYTFQMNVVTDGETTYGVVVYGLLLDYEAFDDACDGTWV